MIRYQASENYYQNLNELLQESPELIEVIDLHIKWFSNNSDDTRLDDHELTKKMKGKSAFSITGDIRIIYKWLGKNEVRFLAIGGHPKVYSR